MMTPWRFWPRFGCSRSYRKQPFVLFWRPVLRFPWRVSMPLWRRSLRLLPPAVSVCPHRTKRIVSMGWNSWLFLWANSGGGDFDGQELIFSNNSAGKQLIACGNRSSRKELVNSRLVVVSSLLLLVNSASALSATKRGNPVASSACYLT